jgi:hypothetical protein
MSVCKHCGQIKVIDAWTPLDLASMAKIAGKRFEDLYAYCYLETTSHMHATGAGMTARMVHTDQAWLYKLDTTEEARVALTFAHNLILLNFGIQNDYFVLGLDDLIRKRIEAFGGVWDMDDKTQANSSLDADPPENSISSENFSAEPFKSPSNQ